MVEKREEKSSKQKDTSSASNPREFDGLVARIVEAFRKITVDGKEGADEFLMKWNQSEARITI